MDRYKTGKSGQNGRHVGEARELRSDHQIDTYLSPSSLETTWRTIWIIIGKVRDLCLDCDSMASLKVIYQADISDTVRIVDLAWTRWCSRRHAAGLHELALHVQLSNFIATMRVLQIACELGPTKLVTQQVAQAHHEALSVHVFLKDARRVPYSLGNITIPPPVPLRPRDKKRLQPPRSPGPDDISSYLL